MNSLLKRLGRKRLSYRELVGLSALLGNTLIAIIFLGGEGLQVLLSIFLFFVFNGWLIFQTYDFREHKELEDERKLKSLTDRLTERL